MRRSHALWLWSVVGVPAVSFGFVVWANATVQPGQPPLPGWRWPFYWSLFAVLLICGILALANTTAPARSRFVRAVAYGPLMAFFLWVGGAVISVMCGDIG